MLSEILKIQPRLDSGDLAKAERTLLVRFNRVAKKFGDGLLTTLKGGAIGTLALTLFNKVLNPLEEVRTALERTLEQGDDLMTFATQFNTTAGNLQRLQSFAAAKGVDAEALRLLLGKFQSAVAQEKFNPGSNPEVSAFVGKKDTAEAFFSWIQSLQRVRAIDPTAAAFIEEKTFGQKLSLKNAALFAADFRELAKGFADIDTKDLTRAAKNAAVANDVVKGNAARLGELDFIAKDRLINGDPRKGTAGIGPNTVTGVFSAADEQRKRNENLGITSIQGLANLQFQMNESMQRIEKGFNKLAPALARFVEIFPDVVDKLSIIAGSTKGVEKSRAARQVQPGGGKGY